MRLHLAGFSGPVAELAATGGRVAWWGVGSNRESGLVVSAGFRVGIDHRVVLGFMDLS